MNRFRRIFTPSRTFKLTAAATVTYVTYRLAKPDPEDLPARPLPVLLPTPKWALTYKFYYPPAGSAAWNLASAATITTIGLFSKFFLNICSNSQVYGLDGFLKVLNDPGRTQPIITVSNHTSMIDDPIIWGMLPIRQYSDIPRMRWTLGAAELCFKNSLFSFFFSLGQVIPTVRSLGIKQYAMDYTIIELLNSNKWVHVFPEARVNQTGNLIRFKWGIGRLIMESKEIPIVIPMWHRGLEKVFPENTGWRPRLGRKVMILLGEPIEVDDLVKKWKNNEMDEIEARILITARIWDEIDKLRVQGMEAWGK